MNIHTYRFLTIKFLGGSKGLSDNLRIVFRLTNSQRMALLDILMEHWTQCNDVTESFVDCSQSPVVETQYGDLLRLFTDMSEMEISKGESDGHENSTG